MSMEKQGVVDEGHTKPEDQTCKSAGPQALKSAADKLAEDHTISRLIQGLGQHRRPMRPMGGT